MLNELTLKYLPIDRCLEYSGALTLPEEADGSVLFMDISGFTPLTEALTEAHGDVDGAQALTRIVNQIYHAHIEQVHLFHGSVISFAGDAMTCWFDDTWRAVTCALAMQSVMQQFAALNIRARDGSEILVELSIKIAITSGVTRRFVGGDPDIQQFDVLIGEAVTNSATAEHQAHRGELIIDSETYVRLQGRVDISDQRNDEDSQALFFVVDSVRAPAQPDAWERPDPKKLTENQIRPWLLPSVYERIQSGGGEFVTELRPVVIFFMRFQGIDYHLPEAREQLDGFVRWVQGVIQEYDGKVFQLIVGDKGSYLYGAFGAPIAHQDDAWRACTSALKMIELIGLFFTDIHSLQIGLTAGVLPTGAYGGVNRRTYGILGDEVNLAARLMQAAAPGQVLVSSDVQAAVSRRFQWEGLPPFHVKGKKNLVRAFRLLSGTTRDKIQTEEPASVLPLIGRQTELERLLNLLDATRTTTGQIIALAGDAGMGKSRLLAEFIRQAQQQNISAYGGECQPYSSNTPYAAWQPLLMQLFGLKATDSPLEHVAILENELRRQNPILLTRLPLLSGVLNLPVADNATTRLLEPRLRKAALEALMLDCIRFRAREARARGAALLLVVEDVQWIDPTSHDFLEMVGRSAPGMGMMLVVTYRPREVDEFVMRLAALPAYTEIDLSHLAPDDMQRLVRAKLDQLSVDALAAPLMDMLSLRAQGNPFYMEELLNYIHDEELLDSPASMIRLPTTLHSLILARIDRLSEQQKITLKVASIIGRMFHLSRLHGYYPQFGGEDVLKDQLDHLSDLELTHLDAPEPEILYLFRHVLTHQVAYESLADDTRRTLHEQFAAYLETTTPDGLLDLIAYHYAYTNNVPKKREYFQRAGESAARRFVNQKAVDYFSQALELIPTGDNREDMLARYDLYRQRDLVYRVLAARDAQAVDIEAMTTLADRLDDDRRRATAALHRAFYTKAIQKFDEAVAAGQQTVRLAARAGDTETEIYGYAEWGQALWYKNEFDQAGKQFDIALKKSAPFPHVTAHTLRNMGMLAIRWGEFGQARGHYERAVPLFRDAGDLLGEANCHNDMGTIAFIQGNFAAAHPEYTLALKQFNDMGDRWGVASASTNMGNVEVEISGDYAKAENFLRDGLLAAHEVGDTLTEIQALIGLGFMSVAQGKYDPAAAHYEQALPLTQANQASVEEAITLNNQGILAYYLGDFDTARARYESALAIRREVDDPIGESETLALLALMAIEQGDFVAAEQFATPALRIAVRHEASLEAARAHKMLGFAMIGQNRLVKADNHFRKSVEIYAGQVSKHMAIEALAGQAQVLLLRNRAIDALKLVNRVLLRINSHSTNGLEDRFRTLLICHQVLEANNKAQRARTLRNTARALLDEHAASLSDAARAQSFRQNLSANRALLAE